MLVFTACMLSTTMIGIILGGLLGIMFPGKGWRGPRPYETAVVFGFLLGVNGFFIGLALRVVVAVFNSDSFLLMMLVGALTSLVTNRLILGFRTAKEWDSLITMVCIGFFFAGVYVATAALAAQFALSI